MSELICEKCFHYEACSAILYRDCRNATAILSTVVRCEHFIDKNCVRLEMTEAQIKEVAEHLNQKAQEFVDLKTMLENGERSLDFYKKVMGL